MHERPSDRGDFHVDLGWARDDERIVPAGDLLNGSSAAPARTLGNEHSYLPEEFSTTVIPADLEMELRRLAENLRSARNLIELTSRRVHLLLDRFGREQPTDPDESFEPRPH